MSHGVMTLYATMTCHWRVAQFSSNQSEKESATALWMECKVKFCMVSVISCWADMRVPEMREHGLNMIFHMPMLVRDLGEVEFGKLLLNRINVKSAWSSQEKTKTREQMHSCKWKPIRTCWTWSVVMCCCFRLRILSDFNRGPSNKLSLGRGLDFAPMCLILEPKQSIIGRIGMPTFQYLLFANPPNSSCRRLGQCVQHWLPWRAWTSWMRWHFRLDATFNIPWLPWLFRTIG